MTAISASTTIPASSTGAVDPQLAAMIESLPADQQQQALAELQAMTPAQQQTVLAQLSDAATEQPAVAPIAGAADAAVGADIAKPPSTMSTMLKRAAIFGAAGAALGFGASFLTLPVIGQVAAPIAAAVGGGIGVIVGIVSGLVSSKNAAAKYETQVAEQQAGADSTAQMQAPVAPEPVDEPAPVPAPAPTSRKRNYTVVAGDNLSVIAARHGLTWQQLYRANREAVGSNPNLIHPGLRLRIPAG
jgi:LysM repeat protein